MKSNHFVLVLAVALFMSPLVGSAQGFGGKGAGGDLCHQALLNRLETLAIEALSPGEEAALIHMREEEKLARDVYLTLAEEWPLPIFRNIARAEQRHMDLMATLLERHDIPDPVANDSIGAFSSSDFAELFDDLVATGQSSLEQALTVGATIEDLDLADLDRLMMTAGDPGLTLIANNLAKGSRNHLRAFVGKLNANGFGSYTAQHLTQDQVDEIVGSNSELRIVYDESGNPLTTCGSDRGYRQGRGGRACDRGQGAGYGRGRGQGRGPRDGSCVRTGSRGN